MLTAEEAREKTDVAQQSLHESEMRAIEKAIYIAIESGKESVAYPKLLRLTQAKVEELGYKLVVNKSERPGVSITYIISW